MQTAQTASLSPARSLARASFLAPALLVLIGVGCGPSSTSSSEGRRPTDEQVAAAARLVRSYASEPAPAFVPLPPSPAVGQTWTLSVRNPDIDVDGDDQDGFVARDIHFRIPRRTGETSWLVERMTAAGELDLVEAFEVDEQGNVQRAWVGVPGAAPVERAMSRGGSSNDAGPDQGATLSADVLLVVDGREWEATQVERVSGRTWFARGTRFPLRSTDARGEERLTLTNWRDDDRLPWLDWTTTLPAN